MGYKRVDIEQARKLWNKGENIYILPAREGDPIHEITVHTNKRVHSSFDYFVKLYREKARAKLRYYIRREAEV